MKLNKIHKGKEFQSSFRFVGKVESFISGIGDDTVTKPIFEQREVRNSRQMRFVVFNVLTDKYNKIKVELNALEQQFAYPYSSKHKKTVKVDWANRFNKASYPDSSYHLIKPDWDICQEIGDEVSIGDWVEVRGHYEFDTYIDNEGNEHLLNKKIIDNVNILSQSETEGKVFYINKETGKTYEFNYVMDFDNEKFKEINDVFVEVGIRSIYQDEETKDVKINGVFLSYGKDASVPKDIELMVYYKEPVEGKVALADTFTRLERGDFVKLKCIENNRPTFGEVEKEVEESDNPFADADVEQVVRKSYAINGNRRGLEVVTTEKGGYMKGLLSEEEIEGVKPEEEVPDWMQNV